MSLTLIIAIWQEYWPMFLRGTWVTIYISITGTILGTIIGLATGILRTIPLPKKKPRRILLILIHKLISIYIEFFRGTPMIVQAMVIYYGIAQAYGIQMDRSLAALFIVSINTGAYMSEIVRGGILSIDKGQFEAANAIGMSHFQTMTTIILPQVIRNILPATGNEFVINIKDTSVLNVISVTELFFSTKSISGATFKFFEPYLITCLIYLVLTITITRILRYIERKMDGPANFIMAGNQMQVK